MPSETPKVSPTLLWKPANVVIDELSSIENQINKPSNSFVSQNSLCSSAVEIHKWKVKNSTQSYDQLQKYLRHCTVFWHKWRVHGLVLVIPPAPLIKVASNTRPYSKLRGTTWEGGGTSVLYFTDLWPGAIWSKKGCVPWECLIIFATGCRVPITTLVSKKFQDAVLWNNPMKLCVNKVKVNRLL